MPSARQTTTPEARTYKTNTQADKLGLLGLWLGCSRTYPIGCGCNRAHPIGCGYSIAHLIGCGCSRTRLAVAVVGRTRLPVAIVLCT